MDTFVNKTNSFPLLNTATHFSRNSDSISKKNEQNKLNDHELNDETHKLERGLFLWSNGDKYDGSYKSNNRHGHGKLVL